MCVLTFQVIYMIGLVVSVGLTVSALSLPQWLEESESRTSEHFIGLFQKCVSFSTEHGFVFNCSKFWDHLDSAERAGIVCLFLSVAMCVIAFAWSVVAYYGCCLRGLMTEPLPYITSIAFVLNLAGLICITHDRDIGEYDFHDAHQLGVSTLLAFAGLAVLLVTTLVSVGLSLSAKFCPC